MISQKFRYKFPFSVVCFQIITEASLSLKLKRRKTIDEIVIMNAMYSYLTEKKKKKETQRGKIMVLSVGNMKAFTQCLFLCCPVLKDWSYLKSMFDSSMMYGRETRTELNILTSRPLCGSLFIQVYLDSLKSQQEIYMQFAKCVFSY